jgi:hypothetical protein
MEVSVVSQSSSIPTLQQRIDQSENRIDLWNDNRQALFELARKSSDRRVQRAYAIWMQNLKESIDDPKYGDDLFEALFCAHNDMSGVTPNFFYKRMWTEAGKIVYKDVILRKDMCGYKKWSKHRRIVFDGLTHEFRIKNEEFGYPITVL